MKYRQPQFKQGLDHCSVVIPACNEELTIGSVVTRCLAHAPLEVIVVDDGSRDGTARIAESAGATVIRHPYRKGNGASIKTGARNAAGEVIAFLDGDGQHDPDDLPRLHARVANGYDLIIGARNPAAHASRARRFGNSIYNRLASWMVGQRIEDLTSGYRIVRTACFREFLHMLPNGFSYPTTSTMAFFRSGYDVGFESINVGRRTDGSTSHIRLFRDGGRFLLIIFRIAALYSPLKIFFPAASALFLAGLAYYVYTFASDGRFTNFGVLLLTTSMLVFLIGLVSEQITTLMYQRSDIAGNHSPTETSAAKPVRHREH